MEVVRAGDDNIAHATPYLLLMSAGCGFDTAMARIFGVDS